MTEQTYTWQQISEKTGLTDADLDALTAEWIGEPGYLDENNWPTQATLDLLMEQAQHAEPPTYNVNRDGLADLAMSVDMDEALRAALDDEDGEWVAEAVNDRISAKLAEHGVTPQGEWLGDWSPTNIVAEVLRARDDVSALGAARQAARLEFEHRTDLLRLAVARAMARPDANESAITRAARVDRMTVRKWAGKG
jgi:hypothetical protein